MPVSNTEKIKRAKDDAITAAASMTGFAARQGPVVDAYQDACRALEALRVVCAEYALDADGVYRVT